MKKSKILSICISCILIALLLSGCGSSKSSEGENNQKTVFKVGMITDEGGLGDKSFNDATYEGLSRAEKEFGFKLQILEPQKDSEFESYLDRVSKVSDLVFGVGYKLKNAIEKISKQNSNLKYVLIDDRVDSDNVLSLNFKEEEGSFLAGVLAGVTTKTNKIGFIGGIENTLIEKFAAGFIAGVKSVNHEAGKLLEDGITLRYAGSFSDTTRGYEISKSLYSSGVDVIYHASGGVGIGIFRAAQETGNYAIGVDQDQSKSLPEYSDVILTSVVKNLNDGVYKIVKDVMENKFTPGVVELGVKENGIYLSDFKDKVSEENLNKIEDYKNKIISGEIIVPKTIDEVKKFNN